jgi:hypothetical protein
MAGDDELSVAEPEGRGDKMCSCQLSLSWRKQKTVWKNSVRASGCNDYDDDRRQDRRRDGGKAKATGHRLGLGGGGSSLLDWNIFQRTVFRASNNIPVPAIHGKLPGTGRRKFPV